MIESTEIIPASLMLLDEEQLDQITARVQAQLQKELPRCSKSEQDQLCDQIQMDLETLQAHLRQERLYPYLAYLDDNSSLLDYCPDAQIVLSQKDVCQTHLHQLMEETVAYLQEMSQERKMLPKFSVFHSLAPLLASRQVMEMDGTDTRSDTPRSMIREVGLPQQTLAMRVQIALQQSRGQTLIFVLPSAQLREVAELLRQQQIAFASQLPSGCEVVLLEGQLDQGSVAVRE